MLSQISQSSQAALDAHVYHVENEIQVRAANIVRARVLACVCMYERDSSFAGESS